MKRHELTERERQSIIFAHGADATLEELARRFRISRDRLVAIWTEAGLSAKRRGPSIEYGSERPRGAGAK